MARRKGFLVPRGGGKPLFLAPVSYGPGYSAGVPGFPVIGYVGEEADRAALFAMMRRIHRRWHQEK